MPTRCEANSSWSSTPMAGKLELRCPAKMISPSSDSSFGGWRTASGALLLHLLVEWRPFFYSSWAECLMGGSSTSRRRPRLLSPACRRRRSCGGPIAPSGLVPGRSRFGSVLEFVTGTELQFSFLNWGPVRKMQGLICIFTFFILGPCIICACTVPFNI